MPRRELDEARMANGFPLPKRRGPAGRDTDYLHYSPTHADLLAAEDYEAKLYAVIRRCEAWCELDPDNPESLPVQIKMARLHREWDAIEHGDVPATEEFLHDLSVEHAAGLKLFHKLEKLMAPEARYLHPKQVASVVHSVFTMANELSECISAVQFLQWEKEEYLHSVKREKGLN